MRRIEAFMTIGQLDADRKEAIAVEESATDEEIDDAVWEWAQKYLRIEWGEE
jgi:hypothetical protein